MERSLLSETVPAAAPALPPPAAGQAIRLDVRSRLLAAGVAVACLTVLIVAAWVDPARGGTGTHLQIGMAPCGFLERTGLPCGTCGMTTSFAHFVRGNVVASLYVQPFGCLAALAAGVGFWVAGHAALTARPAYRVLRRLPVGWTGGVLLTMWILAWGWKMLLVVRGADGW